tara:strand:+ start:1388 stop:1768 length:381 start_codon:yes stop_codon:yes gene_type:complete
MSFADERVEIQDRLEVNWIQTPIQWDNISFKQPNNSPWIRLNIINGATEYRALQYKKRYNGIINVQIFVPIKTGTTVAREYADSICSIFDSVNFETVSCDVATVTIVGSDAKWYQINVDTPYWRDS